MQGSSASKERCNILISQGIISTVEMIGRNMAATKKRKASQKANNADTRERLKGTPFSKAEDLKKASQEIRRKTWEQLEKARIFNELAQKEEYDFIKDEFKEGLRCKYGSSKEHLVRVFSEGVGVQIDINKDLVKDVPHSGEFVETLIRSLGDTFSKSYYQAKGIIPTEFSVEDVMRSLKKELESPR
jgi:hypothetical protein